MQVCIDEIDHIDIEYDGHMAKMGEVHDTFTYADNSIFYAVDYSTDKEKEIRKAMLHEVVFAHIRANGKRHKVLADVDCIQIFKPIEDINLMGVQINFHKPPKTELYVV
jgi:hypothetical protein